MDEPWQEGRDLKRREFLRLAGTAGLGLAAGGVLSSYRLWSAQAAPAAGTPRRGGRITFASAALPASIEPHLEGADIYQRRKFLFYETLVWVDFDLVPKPQLAERWEERSATEYIFHLRRGVRFHNGKEMDAEDVKFSYERVMDPRTGSGGRGDLVMIKSIDIIDRHTLRFVLHEPTATFLVNVAGKYNAVIPKDAVRTGRELQHAAVGTGPFVVEAFEPNRLLVLRRFPDYWDRGKPYLDGITFQAVPDESSIVAGLRTGQIDMAQFESGVNFNLVRHLRALNNVQAPGIRWVVLDLMGDMAPTSNPDVRRAIAVGIDREAVLRIAGDGLGKPLGVLPPAMEFWAVPRDRLPNQKRDVGRAREFLQRAGLRPPVPLVIRNIVGFPSLIASVQVIADNLKEVGFDVRVETVDIGVWIRDWIARQSVPTMNEWGGFIDPDQAFYRHYHTPPKGVDFRRWNNAEVDRLLDEGRTTLDRNRRKAIYDRIQMIMAEDPISIPLYAPNLLYSMNRKVKGFRPYPTGFLFGLRDVWIEE
ncbi:MAG: ABC transporter substrate-binding protein [Armatimonadota bacterium]|nr:ABC transporter substrate-binding protein [Armatimonadota bacterium]